MHFRSFPVILIVSAQLIFAANSSKERFLPPLKVILLGDLDGDGVIGTSFLSVTAEILVASARL